MYSSFFHGSSNFNSYLSNSHFYRIISPAILLSNNQESKTIKDAVFHNKKKNIDSDLTLINCKFTFCTSTSNTELDGGAIFLQNNISLRIVNCIFRKNEAKKSGGAIFAKYASLINIDNCLIAENTCRTLGAIRLYQIDEVNIRSTNFTSNKSNVNSGALSFQQISKKVDIEKVNFVENEARLGGVLSIANGIIEIKDSLFYLNKIQTGPTSIKLLTNVTIIIKNTAFSEESTPSISFSTDSEANITNCRFSHTQKDEIINRNANVFIDDNNIFESVLKYEPIQLEPLDDQNIKKNESQINIVKEQKEKNKEEIEDHVIVKYGDKNESIVMLPIQNNMKTNHFYSFVFVIVFIIVIFAWFYCSKKNKKDIPENNGQNNSIFNNDDLDSNANNSFSRANGENLSEVNLKDLPDVKMEAF